MCVTLYMGCPAYKEAKKAQAYKVKENVSYRTALMAIKSNTSKESKENNIETPKQTEAIKEPETPQNDPPSSQGQDKVVSDPPIAQGQGKKKE